METNCISGILIRAATEDDIPRIIEMGHKFNENSPYKSVLLADSGQMRKLAKSLIAQKGILLSEIDGEAVGMIGFYVYPHFLSGEIVAGEIFWWMEPQHRGDGVKLLREAENRARAMGARKMQMIAPDVRVGRLYERIGYSYVESTYQRTLESPG